MRRRSFRPALESLDFRITPSEVIGHNMMAPVMPAVAIPQDDGPDGDQDNPLWNDPSDPTAPPNPDDGDIWLPMIGA